jgi:hypothetical protein
MVKQERFQREKDLLFEVITKAQVKSPKIQEDIDEGIPQIKRVAKSLLIQNTELLNENGGML